MKTKEEIIASIDIARECGIDYLEIDGVKYHTAMKPAPKELTNEEMAEIQKPFSVLDGMSEEEILYWSSPYYDELKVQRSLREEQKKQQEALSG